MLRDQDKVISLISGIYAAAVDPEPTAWPAMLERLGEALDGAGAILVDHRLPGTIVDIAHARVAPEVPAAIAGGMAGSGNPLLAALPRLPLNVPLSVDEVIDEAEFMRSEIFNDLLRPAGLRHFTAAVLEREARSAVTMSLVRDSRGGPFTNGDSELLGCLLPHLAGAALVRRRLATALATADGSLAALHHLDRCVLLLDAEARVTYANGMAERLLARRDGLSVARDGALAAARPADTTGLRRLVAGTVEAGRGRRLAAGRALKLPRPSGDRPLVARAAPLAPSATAALPSYARRRPEVALFVTDPEEDASTPESLLRQAYGLSRAEAALAACVVRGMSLREAAGALGVGHNTAKTQLKSVFAKLDVDRQAALVRRVLLDLGGIGNGAPIP